MKKLLSTAATAIVALGFIGHFANTQGSAIVETVEQAPITAVAAVVEKKIDGLKPNIGTFTKDGETNTIGFTHTFSTTGENTKTIKVVWEDGYTTQYTITNSAEGLLYITDIKIDGKLVTADNYVRIEARFSIEGTDFVIRSNGNTTRLGMVGSEWAEILEEEAKKQRAEQEAIEAEKARYNSESFEEFLARLAAKVCPIAESTSNLTTYSLFGIVDETTNSDSFIVSDANWNRVHSMNRQVLREKIEWAIAVECPVVAQVAGQNSLNIYNMFN